MTHRVPGLLSKNLSKGYHVSVVVELFSEVDHVVGVVLLVTSPSGSEKSSRRVDGNWIALNNSSGCIL